MQTSSICAIDVEKRDTHCPSLRSHQTAPSVECRTIEGQSRKIGKFEVLFWRETVNYIQFWGSTLPKIRIASKKASNESCSKLNYVQNSLWAHMTIPLWSGARGLERLAVWSIILKGNSKLYSISDSMLPKIRIVSKKASNKSCSELNYVQKSHERICLSTTGTELGSSKYWQVEVLLCRETAHYIQFRAQCCQKYASHEKNISYQNIHM